MRSSISLNGKWRFEPIFNDANSLEIPENIKFKHEIIVPSIWRYVMTDGGYKVREFEPFNLHNYPREWANAQTGVYNRKFIVPESMEGHKIFLNFNGLMQRSQIYLNGKAIAYWNESFLPLKIDITDYVIIGESNDLTVICSSYEKAEIESGEQKITDLRGSWFGTIGRGIWQDVALESTPKTYIDDLYVTTSVRNNEICFETDIQNYNSDKDISVKITLSDGRIFESDTINVDKNTKISIKEKWSDPVLWDIDNPYLYNATAEIIENGTVLDTKSLRFGFREFWTEGKDFILNGTKINLRGDSWHFQGEIQMTREYAENWYKMCKENGVNYIRLHAEPYPEIYLEAADELGMLIVDETAIYGSAKSMDAASPVFIENCENHIKRLVKRDRNHPSIIIWSLQNEMRWVDGRDEYKKYIPEMINITNELDYTRPVYIEGDNRLISKENTQIYSLHYNIDGTIEQWERDKPLIIGEHGGWWYICPQNSSAYIGLSAYESVADCSAGIAIKEKLTAEYARRYDVSGISTFNFAHYMMKSMPNEDVITPKRIIRKNSLTINNGQLADYPMYIPNVSMKYLKEAFEPVTIINREYNTSFYDDQQIIRNFDVYNDTRKDQDCLLEFDVCLGEEIIFSDKQRFSQKAGERLLKTIKFAAPMVCDIKQISLETRLFHADKLVKKYIKEYKIYPSDLKIQKIKSYKKTAYIGGDESFEIISNLTDCERITDYSKINEFDVLIIGKYFDGDIKIFQSILKQFTENGGAVIQLEQDNFAVGDLYLQKKSFFSAHMSDSNHKILNGLSDDDFIFWKQDVTEERPDSIIEQCFVKPTKGDINLLLECSAGDFGDGGDLWTPLFEYGYKKGTIIFNQLEITENYYNVPQACLLLRNMIEYVYSFEKKSSSSVGVVNHVDFIKYLGMEYEIASGNFNKYNIIIADLKSVSETQADLLREYVNCGGCLVVLPVSKTDKDKLERLTGQKAEIKNESTYQLKKVCDDSSINGVSVCDLYGFDKPNLSPRMVENKIICENSVKVGGSKSILKNVTGEPWYDYYINKYDAEYSRIALVNMNIEQKKEPENYFVSVKNGKGTVLISQIVTDTDNEKSIRFYSRLFSNLGVFVNGNAFSYEKSDKDFSVDYFMTLPYNAYHDYDKEEAYFTDKEYSLNNLGEGLYGWMKKVEKDRSTGLINISDSAALSYFLTCFVYKTGEDLYENYKLEIPSNSELKVWVNGEKAGIDVVLNKGLNRLVIYAKSNGEDISIMPVFKTPDGKCAENLRYELTIDEVDPK